jgi:hypothetical protein
LVVVGLEVKVQGREGVYVYDQGGKSRREDKDEIEERIE